MPNRFGETAFDCAIQHHYRNIAKLLNPNADIETLTMLSNLIEKQDKIVSEQQNSKQEQQKAIQALSGELFNLRKDFVYEQQKTRTVQEQQHKERLEIEEERLRREKERRNNEFFLEKWKKEEEREWREEVLKKLS